MDIRMDGAGENKIAAVKEIAQLNGILLEAIPPNSPHLMVRQNDSWRS